MQKQSMRIGPVPKLQWKILAVTSPDPVVFARELQGALQELTDDGFAITGQLQRGEALIISASRVTQPVAEAARSSRRRIVDLPAARQVGTPYEEVLYHFSEHGVQKQRVFPVLVDALRAMKEDLARAEIVPLNITTIATTRFEPESFTYLLQIFAEDLQAPPG